MSKIKFLLYILMKKIEKQPIDKEMQQLLNDNNYTPLEEWKANAAIQNTPDNSENGLEGNGKESENNTKSMEI